MKEAAVQTSVNVSLNQHDMVELMLEEQKENIETQIQEKSEELGKFQKEAEAQWDLVTEGIIAGSGIRSTKSYKEFNKLAGGFSDDPKGQFELTTLENFNKGEEQEFYYRFNIERLEGYAKPMTQYKKTLANIKSGDTNSYSFPAKKIFLHAYKPGNIIGSFDATSNDGALTLSYSSSLKSGDYKISAKNRGLVTKYNNLNKKVFETQKAIHELELQLFFLEHDNARNKAKFVKGLLANSDTGKELVQLMGTVKGTNLVQIGAGK